MTVVHSENFRKILAATTKVRGLSHKQQVDKLQNKIVPAIANQVEKTSGKIKKLYETAHNCCASLAEGLKTHDAGPSDFKEVVAELAELADKAKVVETTPKTEKKVSLAVDSQEWINHQGDLAQKVLLSYRKYEKLVPRSLTKKFMANRLPIVPLTSTFFNQDKLAQYKLLDNQIFGYPILKNQVVLGLNTNWYKPEEIEESIKDVIGILRQQTGREFLQLGIPKFRKQVAWVWLADAPTIAKLNKAAVGGHFAVKGWSFPFEADNLMRRTSRAGGV